MYNGRAFWHHADAMASSQERRHTIRIATNGRLQVESERPGPSLRLVDVGTGGFGAQSTAVMPLGVVNSYRFTTPDGAWSATLQAKTVYCRAEARDGRPTGEFTIGFSFVSDQRPGLQQQLMAMIDRATGFPSSS
jgi:hypothetical protein